MEILPRRSNTTVPPEPPPEIIELEFVLSDMKDVRQDDAELFVQVQHDGLCQMEEE